MLNRNVVDNILVFVEFNWTYKLLFVSCLLDQKIFSFHEIQKIPWPDAINWEEWIQTVVLKLKKKMKERKHKILFFVLCWSIFNYSRPNICGMKILKKILIECTLTRQSLAIQKKREKLNKPTTQESSSPSGGNVRFVPLFFCYKCLLKFQCKLKIVKLKGTR